MSNHAAQRISPGLKISLVCSLIASTIAAAVVYIIPELEIQLFARGTATLAGLFSGAPVLAEADGWLLPILSQPVLVNEACSGTDFFLLATALLAWHLPGACKKLPLCIPMALVGGCLFAMGVNALRIVCLAQAHYWIIPRLPENYAGFIHMSVGIAVFLPALILLNIAFEYHDRERAR